MVKKNSITVIAAINDRRVSEQNLLRSSLLQANSVQFIPAEGFTTISRAYNYGLAKSTGDLLIFAHQDVYIPANWYQQLSTAINILDKACCSWGVLGVIGVNNNGLVKGCSWSTGIGSEVGTPIGQPERAVSLDELILIVRKSSGLRFDDNLPGWHLYGTDMVQEALKREFGGLYHSRPSHT